MFAVHGCLSCGNALNEKDLDHSVCNGCFYRIHTDEEQRMLECMKDDHDEISGALQGVQIDNPNNSLEYWTNLITQRQKSVPVGCQDKWCVWFPPDGPGSVPLLRRMGPALMKDMPGIMDSTPSYGSAMGTVVYPTGPDTVCNFGVLFDQFKSLPLHKDRKLQANDSDQSDVEYDTPPNAFWKDVWAATEEKWKKSKKHKNTFATAALLPKYAYTGNPLTLPTEIRGHAVLFCEG